MEQVEVEITGQAITAQYGTLNTGTILRTTPEFAKHLVEDCSAAKYVHARAEPAAATVSTPEPAPVPAPAPAPVPEPAPEPAPVPEPEPAATPAPEKEPAPAQKSKKNTK